MECFFYDSVCSANNELEFEEQNCIRRLQRPHHIVTIKNRNNGSPQILSKNKSKYIQIYKIFATNFWNQNELPFSLKYWPKLIDKYYNPKEDKQKKSVIFVVKPLMVVQSCREPPPLSPLLLVEPFIHLYFPLWYRELLKKNRVSF